jgi:acyl carrier protein
MTIEQKLLNLVKEEFNKKKLENINLDLALRADLGLDSLSMTELVVACEEEFNIEIDVDHPETVRATHLRHLYNAIVHLLGETEPSK